MSLAADSNDGVKRASARTGAGRRFSVFRRFFLCFAGNKAEHSGRLSDLRRRPRALRLGRGGRGNTIRKKRRHSRRVLRELERRCDRDVIRGDARARRDEGDRKKEILHWPAASARLLWRYQRVDRRRRILRVRAKLRGRLFCNDLRFRGGLRSMDPRLRPPVTPLASSRPRALAHRLAGLIFPADLMEHCKGPGLFPPNRNR